MRILLSPLPRSWGGPGIFQVRTARELARRGYRLTSFLHHYVGIGIPRWDAAFMLGCPRFRDRILRSGKPFVTTMGKPAVREEMRAAGRPYLPAFARQEMEMLRVLRISPKVVFISHHALEVWQDLFGREGVPFLEEGRYRVIHHGVDTEAFRPPAEGGPAQQDGPFCLGTVGAMRNPYRLRTFFQTSALLGFDHRLLLVGSMDSDCAQEYARATRDPRVASRTRYVPWIQADSLPPYYHQMHCLFHPVDHESCSNVVIEALACGVPVVIPAHGAPQEFLLPRGGIAVATRQFSYDDEFCRRMADAVSKIREDWRSFAVGARAMALQNLDIRRRVADYLDFLGLPPCLPGGKD
jgi:glycosyltransferase involved in cell wall biosynthesis